VSTQFQYLGARSTPFGGLARAPKLTEKDFLIWRIVQSQRRGKQQKMRRPDTKSLRNAMKNREFPPSRRSLPWRVAMFIKSRNEKFITIAVQTSAVQSHSRDLLQFNLIILSN
jgi:hypothetical protein